MRYRVAIYDLEYDIEAKSTESAIRAAIARYAKTETAQSSRHCSPDRLTHGPKVVNGRRFSKKPAASPPRHLGRWAPCKYIQGAASIQAHQPAAVEPEAIAEPAQNRSVPPHLIVGR